MEEYRRTLKSEFQDEEYRYAYAEEFLNTSIAAQIRVLREQRNNMTQQELADKLGTKQAGISRLENVNYSAWKTETLRKIARALGVRLRISFETFGTLLDEAERFRKETLQRPDFENDPAFGEADLEKEITIPDPRTATDETEAAPKIMHHIWHAPYSDGLIENQWIFGSQEAIKKKFANAPEHRVVCQPSAKGAELFLWAFGYGASPLEHMLSGQIDTAVKDLPNVVPGAIATRI